MNNINLKKIKIIPHNGNEKLDNFKCKHNDLDEFLKKDSIIQKNLMLNSTYLAIYEEKIIGFFTLSTDKIKLKQLGEEYGKSFKNKNIYYNEFPTLKLGRLGVSSEFERKGIGSFLFKWIIYYSIEMSKSIGFRFLTIDAYINAYGFYKKNQCNNLLNEQQLKNIFKKYDKAKINDKEKAYKMTLPLYLDLYKFKTNQ